ncbi:uncharacterized protein LOC128957096 [Oppia nitens]|uniref:uncharacterized protein LOC128957096 n=1 Tax=Oppia nitens TaxID=1686743 RepID=UPI0023DA0CD4|nr:uncharacterized protein LOC128957096 [Oppia nitens]
MEYCIMSLKVAIKLKAQVFNRQLDEPMDCMEYFITCEILREVLECVRYLHELKPPVIHRDIKPDNLLIANNIIHGRFIKLGDLGLITVHKMVSKTQEITVKETKCEISNNDGMVSQSHTIGVGTPKYMAPEVYSENYNTKSDVYSIGVMIEDLFEIDVYNSRTKYISHEWNDKYCKLLDIAIQMMETLSDDRPTCANIIEQYTDWAINGAVVTTDTKFKQKLEKLRLNEWNIRLYDVFNEPNYWPFFHTFIRYKTQNLVKNYININRNNIDNNNLNDWFTIIEKFYVFDDQMGINMLFVTHDDRVYGLGANAYGSLGLGHNQYVSQPQEIEDLRDKKIINIINGYSFVIFQSSDNYLFICGQTENNVFSRPMKCKINENNNFIYDASCGSDHILVLTHNNEVYGWGNNQFGQIGSRDTTCEFINIFEKTEFNNKYFIYSIYCSDMSSFALTSDGQVFSWGHNRRNKLGLNTNDMCICRPKLICNLTGITSIQSGRVNTYFSNENDNIVYYCGEYFNENNEIQIQETPKFLGNYNEFINIQSIISHKWNSIIVLCSLNDKAIKLKAQVFNRQLGEPMDCMEYYITCEILREVLECVRYLHELNPPVIHRDLKPDNILIANDIRSGQFIKIGDLGLIRKIISNVRNETQISKQMMTSMDEWIQMIDKFYVFDDSLGINMLFVTHDDRVYGLGANAYGSLGFGHNQYVSQPQEIKEMSHKKIINFLNGYEFVIFQSSDSNNCLYSCGQLGIGNSIKQKFCRPIKIQITENNHLISDVNCGSYHTLVLTQNNELYGWGSNRFGQIGSRDTACDEITEPEKIELNDSMYCLKSVYCYDYSSFVLTTDGQVFSWVRIVAINWVTMKMLYQYVNLN